MRPGKEQERGAAGSARIFNIYTVITPTLGVLRGELSFPQDKQVEQWPEP